MRVAWEELLPDPQLGAGEIRLGTSRLHGEPPISCTWSSSRSRGAFQDLWWRCRRYRCVRCDLNRGKEDKGGLTFGHPSPVSIVSYPCFTLHIRNPEQSQVQPQQPPTCPASSSPARSSPPSRTTVSPRSATSPLFWLTRHKGPATKVPGLVFLAGQTATGEIKQATVRSGSPSQSKG